MDGTTETTEILPQLFAAKGWVRMTSKGGGRDARATTPCGAHGLQPYGRDACSTGRLGGSLALQRRRTGGQCFWTGPGAELEGVFVAGVELALWDNSSMRRSSKRPRDAWIFPESFEIQSLASSKRSRWMQTRAR